MKYVFSFRYKCEPYHVVDCCVWLLYHVCFFAWHGCTCHTAVMQLGNMWCTYTKHITFWNIITNSPLFTSLQLFDILCCPGLLLYSVPNRKIVLNEQDPAKYLIQFGTTLVQEWKCFLQNVENIWNIQF